MSTRQEKAQAYTDEGELKPLTWGRVRIARKALGDVDELPDEDAASLAAALYLMEFQALRSIAPQNLIEEANKFAEPLPAPTVLACGEAFGRDMGALEAGAVTPADEGKPEAVEEPNLSPAQASLSPGYV